MTSRVARAGLPRPLLHQGVRDLVRVMGARMGGTPYGTVVLHVAAEAAVGHCLTLDREGSI